MLRVTCLAAVSLMAIASVPPAADEAATRPASSPTTAPAPAAAPLHPAVEKALNALEAAGKSPKHAALKADVRYAEEEMLFEDVTVMTGQVYYHKDPGGKVPARFRIHFDRIRQGRRGVKADRDYAFYTDATGQWLVSRNADIKQQVTYQIARPGETKDPLALGKGPFPLPFGQKKADVLRLFGVTTRKLTDQERKELGEVTYLLLSPTPAAAKDLKVKRVELWVDVAGLPIQIRLQDADGQVEKTARFTKINRVQTLSDSDLRPRPPGSGWEVRVEPLHRVVKGPPSG